MADLLRHGKKVRAIDVNPIGEWLQVSPDAENRQLDLREKSACQQA